MIVETHEQPANQDPGCFVFGFILDGQGGGWRSSDSDHDGPRWFHIDYSHASAEQWLAEQDLPEVIVTSLVRADTRPRTLMFDTGALVFLRGINTNPGADPEDMVSLRMWIESDRLITVRQRKLLSIQDLRSEIETGQGPKNIPELVVDLIERLADRVATFVDQIEEQVSDIESELNQATHSSLRLQISELRRQTALVRRYLAPQREALESLYRHSRKVFDEGQAHLIREYSDRFVRYVEDLDLVRERAMVLQEELLNLVVQEQSNRMYLFSVVAAVFLPITFISGVFGMNVAGLPGVEDPVSFWVVAIVMLVVSVGVIGLLRFKRWL
jgi:zinc transporter